MVKPMKLRTIIMLPMTLSAPSSLPVMTIPATLPLIALRPVLLYSSSSASSRSIRRCMRLERPPHQIGVQKSTMSASLIFVTRSGQSSSADSRKPSPTGSFASDKRNTLALIGASARISSSTRDASSPVLDNEGSCLRDAFSAKTLRGASDGMLQRNRGFVLYIATSTPLAARRRFQEHVAPPSARKRYRIVDHKRVVTYRPVPTCSRTSQRSRQQPDCFDARPPWRIRRAASVGNQWTYSSHCQRSRSVVDWSDQHRRRTWCRRRSSASPRRPRGDR